MSFEFTFCSSEGQHQRSDVFSVFQSASGTSTFPVKVGVPVVTPLLVRKIDFEATGAAPCVVPILEFVGRFEAARGTSAPPLGLHHVCVKDVRIWKLRPTAFGRERAVEPA